MAKVTKEETCRGQSQARGGMPWPGSSERGHAGPRETPEETGPDRSAAPGRMPWSERGHRKMPSNVYWSRSHLPKVMLLPLGTRSGNLPKVGVRHDQPAVPDSPTKGRTAPATFGRYTVCVPTKGRNFKSSILHAKMESEITGVCTYRTSGTHCCAPTKGSRGNPTFGRYTKKCTYQR